MQFSEYIDRNNLHHAYLLEGDHQSLFPQIIDFLADDGKNVTQETFELFTIDDARALRMRQSQTRNEKKIFMLAVGFFTREAENALLKVFEEPTPDTHFFVVVPSVEFLLPTLRSRFMVLSLNKENDESLVLKGKAFLKLNKPARLQFVADFIEEYKDEEKHDAQKGVALRLLDAIEAALAASYEKKLPDKKQQFILKEIWKCKNYLRDRGASTKMLLEYVALIS